MAITYVNSVQNSATGTQVTVAMPGGGPGAGNLIVLAVRVMAGITITSITDTLGNDWTPGVPENGFAVSSDHVDYIFYVGKSLAGANTITINTSGSALICAAEAEFTGFGGTGATLDQHNAATGTGTAVDSAAINTVDAAEAVLGVMSGVTGQVLTTTGVPNNWSAREDSGTHKLQIFSQQLATTQSGMKLQGTITSDTWGAMIASFKVAPSVAPMFRGV